jgi:hypothetical protein
MDIGMGCFVAYTREHDLFDRMRGNQVMMMIFFSCVLAAF